MIRSPSRYGRWRSKPRMCQAIQPPTLGPATGFLDWLRLSGRGTSSRLFCIATFLLVVSLSCFFRASVSSMWLFDDTKQHVTLDDGAAHNLTAAATPAGAGPMSWEAEAIYQFASLDLYTERVEKPIIAKVLDSVIMSSGRVQIGGAGQWNSSRRSWGPRRKMESWEIELARPRNLPHWPRFLHLLREWSAARRFDPQVMKELPDIMLNNVVSPHTAPGYVNTTAPLLHKTCAVVGNSGILLLGKHGPFIDSHDMVIRINGAKTQNYESQVGSKTTLAFANSHVLGSYARLPGPCRYPYGPRVPLVVYICQAVNLMNVARCQVSAASSVLLVTDPRLDTLCSRIAKWYSVKQFLVGGGKNFQEWETKHGGIFFHYSSGMQAVVLALGLCEQVHLFGFGKVAGVKHHYHGQQKGEWTEHDYDAEYAFYHHLENNSSAAVAFLNEAQGFLVPRVRVFQ